jgi:hypothetical protein
VIKPSSRSRFLIAGLLAALTLPVYSQVFTYPTVALTSTPNPSVFGAPVTVTATVTGNNPTGRVTFYNGVTVLGTKALSSGTASISTVLLPSGHASLRAYYAGDHGNVAASSSVVTQIVNPKPGNTLVPTSLLTLPEGPRKVVLGDFNGDGKVDLAVVATASQSAPGGVSILLGNGDGTFQPAVTYSVGAGTFDVAVGDFNGDGKADLVVALFAPGVNQVAVLLGNGDGTFQTPVNYGAGAGPTAVVVGDFNQDGKADIAVADAGGAVGILLGNGDGTFQPALFTIFGTYPASLVVGDFDGDGKPDLAVADSGGFLWVLLGNGDGTFQTPVSYQTSGSARSLAVGDFNGDGKPDIAVATLGVAADVFLGAGNGAFQPKVTYAAGVYPQSLTVGDINGDGKLDVAVVNEDGTLSVLLGSGNGTFAAGQSITVGSYPASIAIGDFNGDGTADLAVADGGSNAAAVLLGISAITAVGGTPQTTTVNTPFATALEAEATNANGSPISGIPVTFAAPASGTGATLSSGVAATNAFGVASVTAAANATAGNYTVTASAGGLASFFTLTNSPAALTVTPAAESTLITTAFPQAIQVTVRDARGNLVSGATVNFSAPASGASAVLSSSSAVTNSSGIASVTATADATPGSYAVQIAVPQQGLNGSIQLTNEIVPALTLAAQPEPSMFGAPVTLTLSVLPASATAW